MVKRRRSERPGTILARWGISAAELTRLVDENPSLRGIMLGYVAELKLGELLQGNPNIASSVKFDDHNRRRKGDRVVVYRGFEFIIESKSLQTASVRPDRNGWTGRVQVDGSDRRTVRFGDGTTLETTLLMRGEFDVLAVNCFAFDGRTWRWAFCKNRDLPACSYKRYSRSQRHKLLASMVTVHWPPRPPFSADLFGILDELVIEKSSRGVDRRASRKPGSRNDSSSRGPVS